MRASFGLLPPLAPVCPSTTAPALPALEPAPKAARGSTPFEEVVRDAPSWKGASTGRVVVVRSDASEPFVCGYPRLPWGQTLFEGGSRPHSCTRQVSSARLARLERIAERNRQTFDVSQVEIDPRLNGYVGRQVPDARVEAEVLTV